MMTVKFKIEKNEGYKYISTIEGLGIKKGVGNFGLAAFGRKVLYGIDNLD